MSEKNTGLEGWGFNINAPELSDERYGDNIEEQFRNIHNNFKNIVNAKWLEGKPGASVNTRIIKLSENDEILNKIRNLISKDAQMGLFDIAGRSWDDNFSKSPYDQIIVIEQEGEIISCLPYTYIDARFVGNLSGDQNYQNIIDVSCTITYENGEFVKIQNFPTLYFDDSINDFCWKINNQKTGLIARGPQGSSGGNGTCLIVKFAEDRDGNPIKDSNGWAEILEVYFKISDKNNSSYDWVSVNNALLNGLILNDGCVVVGLVFDRIESSSKIIIAPIKQNDEGKWLCNVSEGADLAGVVNIQAFINTLKTIPNGCPGLFVPTSNNHYHMFSDYSTGDKKNLHIGPSSRADELKNEKGTVCNVNYRSIMIPAITGYHHAFYDYSNNDDTNLYIGPSDSIDKMSIKNGNLCLINYDTIMLGSGSNPSTIVHDLNINGDAAIKGSVNVNNDIEQECSESNVDSRFKSTAGVFSKQITTGDSSGNILFSISDSNNRINRASIQIIPNDIILTVNGKSINVSDIINKLEKL